MGFKEKPENLDALLEGFFKYGPELDLDGIPETEYQFCFAEDHIGLLTFRYIDGIAEEEIEQWRGYTDEVIVATGFITLDYGREALTEMMFDLQRKLLENCSAIIYNPQKGDLVTLEELRFI
jgi:hypothetical protein